MTIPDRIFFQPCSSPVHHLTSEKNERVTSTTADMLIIPQKFTYGEVQGLNITVQRPAAMTTEKASNARVFFFIF